MPILNYSTSIEASRTVGEIQGILAGHGAKSLLIDYENGQPTGISFLVPTQFGDKAFRLPANTDAVWRVLTRQSKEGRVPRKLVTREQASRVGWRIIKDWIAAQMALIESDLADLPTVMLPYLQVKGKQTLAELMGEHQFLLPERAIGTQDGQ